MTVVRKWVVLLMFSDFWYIQAKNTPNIWMNWSLSSVKHKVLSLCRPAVLNWMILYLANHTNHQAKGSLAVFLPIWLSFNGLPRGVFQMLRSCRIVPQHGTIYNDSLVTFAILLCAIFLIKNIFSYVKVHFASWKKWCTYLYLFFFFLTSKMCIWGKYQDTSIFLSSPLYCNMCGCIPKINQPNFRGKL